MSDVPLDVANRVFAQAVDALRLAAGPTAGDADLLAVLTFGEGARRALDQVTVAALAALERRGIFAARGYRSSAAAVADRLGGERADAKRYLSAAEHVGPRTGLDGTPLPPRLAATAAAFDAGAACLRHVEVVARVLGSDAASRLDPQRWAAAEAQLAAWIPDCTPAELQARGSQLVETLDVDGPQPDERPRPCVNELYLQRNRSGSGGGRLVGRFDDAAMFDAIATLLDAQAVPRTAEDDRTPAQRQAEALADACGWVLDHGDTAALSSCGGRRPQLSVLIQLDDLERRVRAACLDFGGTLSPQSLRMLACDAAVVPVVLDGAGQPLDIGRATRTIPDGLRRAVTARDGGCARCGRPPSWCEVHHVRAWEHGGETKLANLVMLCRVCHRLVHDAGWDVRLVGGRAEFVPPPWIDPFRRPRRRPPPLAVPPETGTGHGHGSRCRRCRAHCPAVSTWTSAECAAAWGVQPGTWLGYVSRGQAPPPLPGTDERGRRRWDPDAVRAFPRPGAGRSRAAVTPENEALLAAMTQVADELDALRDRQRHLAREARAGGVEVRAIARALRVSPQTVYGWLDD